MVDYYNIVPSLQLVGAQFLNFLFSSYHVTCNFTGCRYYITFGALWLWYAAL